MKKTLLALAVLAAFSVSAQAEQVISLEGLSWSAWGSSSFDGVNTLTFDGAWEGGQFDVEAINATGYDYIVYDIDPSSVNANITIKGWWGDGMTIAYAYNSGEQTVIGRINDDWEAGMYRIQQLQFQGHTAGTLTINKITLMTAEEAMADGLIKPSVAVEMPQSYGPHVLLSEFVDLDDDTEISIKIANTTDPYSSRNGWGIGAIIPINLWSGAAASYDLKGVDGAEFTVKCLASDLKTVAKNGEESEYYTDTYGQQGVTFNLYNQCELVSVSKMLPASYIRMATAGIQSYVAPTDLDFSKTEDITAYVVPEECTVGEPVTSIVMQEVEQVKAGTPVFVVGNAGEPYYVLEISGAAAVSDNVLAVGNGVTACGSDAYGINKTTGKLAPITPGTVIPDGIVYIPSLSALSPATSAEARMCVGFDGATAIQTIEQENNTIQSYDLYGRRSQAGKGFQIRNGQISVVR